MKISKTLSTTVFFIANAFTFQSFPNWRDCFNYIDAVHSNTDMFRNQISNTMHFIQQASARPRPCSAPSWQDNINRLSVLRNGKGQNVADCVKDYFCPEERDKKNSLKKGLQLDEKLREEKNAEAQKFKEQISQKDDQLKACQEKQHIVFLDLDSFIDHKQAKNLESLEWIDLQDEIDSIIKSYEQPIQIYSGLHHELNKYKFLSSNNVTNQDSENVIKIMHQLIEQRDSLINVLKQKQKNITQKLIKIVEQIARDMGADAILFSQIGNITYIKPAFDITKQVIDELNKEYQESSSFNRAR